MTPLPIAHLGGGHWYEWGIYFAPLLVIFLTIVLERRRYRRQEQPQPTDSQSDDKERP